MKILRVFSLPIAVIGLVLSMQGCAFMAGAAAGAAGGEALEEEGYDLRSPVHKDKDDDD